MPAPRAGCAPCFCPPWAAPRSSPRQVLPAATLSCRALSPLASRALWTQRLCSSLPVPCLLIQHPWIVSADLRTGFLFAYILPTSSVPSEPFLFSALPQIPQQHSRLLTTCCPHSTSTFPRLTLPFGSQPKLYLLLRHSLHFPKSSPVPLSPVSRLSPTHPAPASIHTQPSRTAPHRSIPPPGVGTAPGMTALSVGRGLWLSVVGWERSEVV